MFEQFWPINGIVMTSELHRAIVTTTPLAKVMVPRVQAIPDDGGHVVMFLHANPYWHSTVHPLLCTAVITCEVLAAYGKPGGSGCSHVFTVKAPQESDVDAPKTYSPTP